MPVFGAVEAGGTKFICGFGTGPDDLVTTRIPTTVPRETVGRVAEWFRMYATQPLAALGIGSFGPLNLDQNSAGFGHITNTPKSAWRDFDIAGAFRNALQVETLLITDVQAALLGEQHWGVAKGTSGALYITVGTGIGGSNGSVYAEMGHIRVPHDGIFPGICPYHGDCLEGLASGPALEARWGRPPAELEPDHPAWALEARLLAHALANYTLTLGSPLIIVGGGVMSHDGLYPAIRKELRALLAGYWPEPKLCAPALGERSGILGALSLASQSHDSGL